MKNRILLLGIIVFAGIIEACQCNKMQHMKGVITDASMNTLMIVSANGDTLNVSTLNAERIVQDGILLGDTATVYYKDKPHNGMVQATKIVVVSGERECKELLGAWVQPVNGMPGQVQGVLLKSGGEAKSVNMETLVYEGWKKEGDVLILTGKSIGNGQTIAFADTLHIDKVTSDSLVLSDGGYTEKYTKAE